MLKRIIKLLLAFAAVFCVISANRTDVHADTPYGYADWDPDGTKSGDAYIFLQGEAVTGTLWTVPGYASRQRVWVDVYQYNNSNGRYTALDSWTYDASSSSTSHRKIRFQDECFRGVGQYKLVFCMQYMNPVTYQWISGTMTSTNIIKIVPAPTSVTLDKTKMSVKPGREYIFTATVSPSDTLKTVTWSSSNTSVATITPDSETTKYSYGMMKAVGPGTATITVTTVNGKTAKCEVTVLSEAQISLIRDFVTRLYRLCFNREPDEKGLANWTDSLCNSQKTAAQVVSGFFNSKEMKNLNLSTEDYIERCYSVMMDRASDAGGKRNWIDAVESGVSNTYILRGFVHSNEFTKICNKYGIERGNITVTEGRDLNLGITKFVARCYTKALGRKYDINGLNSWCAMIAKSANQKQAAITVATDGFFHSQEFKNKNTTNEQYVTILYQTFLGRDPDTAGFKDWTGQLSRGTSRDTVLNGFAGSAEFAKIMAGYGIK